MRSKPIQSPVVPLGKSGAGNGGGVARAVLDREAERQRLAIELATELVHNTTTDVVVSMVLDAAYEVLHCECVALFLQGGADGGGLSCSVASGGRQPSPQEASREGPIGRCWSAGEALNIQDAYAHQELCDPFATAGYDGSDCKTRSLLCMPLEDPVQKHVFGVMLAANKRRAPSGEEMHESFDSVDEATLRLFLSLTARQIRVYDLVCEKAKRAKDKFTAFLELLSGSLKAVGGRDLSELVRTILVEAQIIFECDRCSFYAIDNLKNEFIGYQVTAGAQKTPQLEETRFPIEGIVGLVAASGKPLRIPDAWSDARFTRENDIATGFRTRNLLIAPLAASSGRVIAVLQCVNKKGEGSFSDNDELELTTVSALVSDVLQRVVRDSSFQHFKDDIDIDNDVKDMFYEYCLEVESGEIRSMPRKYSRSSMLDFLTLVENMKKWDFDHWSLLEESGSAKPRHIEACFDFFGLVAPFGISTKALGNFVASLQAKYNEQSFYHTWAHAFATFHITFVLADTLELNAVFLPVDLLALLLAALGHDVDHPGFTNQFLINRRHRLALRYNDMSVLESHHASVTCRILEDCFSSDFLQGSLDQQGFRRLHKVIVSSILGTDMAKHQECQSWLESAIVTKRAQEDTCAMDETLTEESAKTVEPIDSESALRLASAVLHCADLSHPTLPWSLHQRLSMLCAEEFFAQYQEEQRLGLPSLPFMGKDPTVVSALAPTQVGFIRFVAAPLWSALTCAVGRPAMLGDALATLNANQDLWQQLADGREGSKEGS